MCIFHKWETKENFKGRIGVGNILFGTSKEQNVVYVLERCLKCEKERAIAITISGEKYNIDLEWFKTYFEIG